MRDDIGSDIRIPYFSIGRNKIACSNGCLLFDFPTELRNCAIRYFYDKIPLCLCECITLLR